MNEELKQKLRDALWAILDGHIEDYSDGICWSVQSHIIKSGASGYESSLALGYMCNLFSKWPYFSGSTLHPIHTNMRSSPSHQYYNTYNMWEGEYGESRIQLVMFLLEQLGDPL